MAWACLHGLGVESSLLGHEGEATAAERFVSACVSLGGLLITALLMGLCSDWIGEYMDGLRQGRSDVIESGHTLVLGASDKLMGVIHQLSLANESEVNFGPARGPMHSDDTFRIAFSR